MGAESRSQRFCALCCEELARARGCKHRPGAVVWAMHPTRAVPWPAWVVCMDFQTPADERPFCVQFFHMRPPQCSAWVGEADLEPWSNANLRMVVPRDRKRHVATVLADMAERAVTAATTFIGGMDATTWQSADASPTKRQRLG